MLSYPTMAVELGVAHCRGITPTGHYCGEGDHKVGFARPGIVHLNEPERIDRRDTLAFLKLAVVALDPSIDDDVPWRRVYRRYAATAEAASRFHLRFPVRHWRADKAFVLASVAALSNEVPLRKPAFDWARR